MIWVLDASVAVRWFLKDEHHFFPLFSAPAQIQPRGGKDLALRPKGMFSFLILFRSVDGLIRSNLAAPFSPPTLP